MTMRLTGLVQATNHIREQLRIGLVPDRVGAFQNTVLTLIRQVEDLCAQQGYQPSQLPTPSFQAYQFLKTLHLDRLPLRDAETSAPSRAVRLKNLLRDCDKLQRQFYRRAIQVDLPALSEPQHDPHVTHWLESIQTQVASLESSIRDLGEPSTLPLPTRNAFAWLKFLVLPGNFALHLQGLHDSIQFSREMRLTLGGESHTINHIEFFNIPTVYRSRRIDQQFHLTASEGFIAAPDSVLHALLLSATSRPRRDSQELRAFATSDECVEILSTLESLVVAVEPKTRGVYYDLDEVFESVNAIYFNGEAPKPKLVWNKTPTYRKLGQYEPNTNTILLSITLDNSTVPEWVIDFVMYHEMLHQVMGAQIVDGRHYAHTPAFREAERRFRSYTQAKQGLDRLLGQIHLRELGA